MEKVPREKSVKLEPPEPYDVDSDDPESISEVSGIYIFEGKKVELKNQHPLAQHTSNMVH